LSEATGLSVPSADAVTLNGYLSGLLGRIPRRGERIPWDGVEFIVQEVTRHRIQRCRIEIHEPAPDREEP
jgi:putative hemolysin